MHERQSRFAEIRAGISADQPVLIAGPTASGKSALALEIAERQGGVIVNADASQVFSCWHIVTARPGPDDLTRAPHALYGHISHDVAYSVGHWLRDVVPLLHGAKRPIIVGGTGLYFTALTQGLADIPATPPEVRDMADTKSLQELIDDLDTATRAAVDTANRARVQRAWEVLTATGRGLADWQAEPRTPLLPESDAVCLSIDAPKGWLTPRIERRFQRMIDAGALNEVAAMADQFDPGMPAFRAIGVPELMGYLNGEHSLEDARQQAVISTRQYAKRQRTWARRHFANWIRVPTD